MATAAHAQQPKWCEAGGISKRSDALQFLSQLQHAVAVEDRAAVTSMIRFPVGYAVPGSPTQLSEREFDARYDQILSPEVKAILARQEVDQLFCDSNGAAIGHGEIWFGPSAGTDIFKIGQFSLSKYARAGVESMADTETMDRTFLAFQRAVKRDDRSAVASMMEYPLRLDTAKGEIKLKSPAALLSRYDFVFDAQVKRAVASTSLSDLFARNDGVAIKGGIVWFRPPTGRGKWTPKVSSVAVNR
jgi:hypothetical protein